MVFTRHQCNSSCAWTSFPNGEFLPTISNTSEYTVNTDKTLVLRSRSFNVQNPQGTTRRNEQTPANILSLPTEVLDHVLSYLPYKTVANLRSVSKRMDAVCSGRLNTTFNKLQHEMLIRFQNIKAQMPRRESLRRKHPLACESDIIETLHMRLTLLQMSFGRHIERKHCCFFPGEILDEVYRILGHIKETPRLVFPFRVTDELFDLTCMAMEYFKDKIEPNLPETYFRNELLDCPSMDNMSLLESFKYEAYSVQPGGLSTSATVGEFDNGCGTTAPPQSNMVLRKRIKKIKQGMRRYNSQLASMQQEMRAYKSKITDQQKIMVDYSKRLDESAKKNDELSRKFGTLLQELNKCKTELQYWKSNGGNPLSPALNVDLDAAAYHQLQVASPAEVIKIENDLSLEDAKEIEKQSFNSGDSKEMDTALKEEQDLPSSIFEVAKDTEQVNTVVDAISVISPSIFPEISGAHSSSAVRVSPRSAGPSKRRHASPEMRPDIKKSRDCINLRSKSWKSSSQV